MKQLLSIVAVFTALAFGALAFAQDKDQEKQRIANLANAPANVYDVKVKNGEIVSLYVVGKASISKSLGARGLIIAERKASMDCDAHFIQWCQKNMTVDESGDENSIIVNEGAAAEGSEMEDEEINKDSGKDSDVYSRVIKSYASGLLKGMEVVYFKVDKTKMQYVIVKKFERKKIGAINKTVKELNRTDDEDDETEDLNKDAAAPKDNKSSNPGKKPSDKWLNDEEGSFL